MRLVRALSAPLHSHLLTAGAATCHRVVCAHPSQRFGGASTGMTTKQRVAEDSDSSESDPEVAAIMKELKDKDKKKGARLEGDEEIINQEKKKADRLAELARRREEREKHSGESAVATKSHPAKVSVFSTISPHAM